MSGKRIIRDISENFFNDGHWYTLTSVALGGMSPEKLADALWDDTGERIRQLLEDGVCLPLAFDADCVLDLRTRFVIGDLSADEEAEWIARVRGRLLIPDGKFVLVGGAMAEDFGAIGSDRTSGYDIVEVEPGRYIVEVYAFVGSYTVNELFYDEDDRAAGSREKAPSARRLLEWWRNTRGNVPPPEWLELWIEEGYVDNDDCELLAYVIRLVESDEKIPVPRQDQHYEWWVTEFQARKPEKCPRGIKFNAG